MDNMKLNHYSKAKYHLQLLDDYAENQYSDLLQQYKNIFNQYKDKRELEDLESADRSIATAS